MDNVKIDLIIPVYKPDAKLDMLMERIRKQSRRPDQILLLYTIEQGEEHTFLKRFCMEDGITVHEIRKEDFDHGGTRNYGASLSNADFIMFMTQDAVPTDRFLVENLLKGFQHEHAGAVYARQLAGNHSGLIEQYTRSFNYPEASSEKTKQDLDRLGIKTYFCSNVCAAYRKNLYDELGGFVTKTIFNEDMILASAIIAEGHSIFYAADAQVIHSHKYTLRQQFTRNFDLGVSHCQYREIFLNVSSESEGLRLVRDTARYLTSRKKIYLIPALILQSGFKFMGYQCGKRYKKLPFHIVKKFSMNKTYWEKKRIIDNE